MEETLRSRCAPAALFLCALLIFAAGLLWACRGLLTAQDQVRHEAADKVSTWGEPEGRTLVILFDSSRTDFTFSEHMPFVSSCRERGAWGISEVVSIPLSVAGQRAIFAGTVANPLAFFEDFHAATSTSENVLMRVNDKGKRVAIFDWFLRGMYGKYSDLSAFQPRTFRFSQYREEASYVFEQAHRFLSTEKWDFVVVAFYALDYLGHLETPRSPNYIPMVRKIDDYVRRLVDLTNDKDVVLITAEHGMDDNGFHMDRSPIVIDCPFVLLGSRIRRGGPTRVLQIDWAPTLSLLAGVSPFYDTPALPNLDLIELPAEDRASLLSRFARTTTGASTPLALDELRAKRLARIAKKGSPVAGVLVALTTLLSMILLAYGGLLEHVRGWRPRKAMATLGGGTLGLCAAICAAMSLGLFDYVSRLLPFSANFILNHRLGVTVGLALLALLPMLGMRAWGKRARHTANVALLYSFAFIFAGVFVSTNPYHSLNWVVLAAPVVAWGISRRRAWLVALCAMCVGLAIRRLTFYHAKSPIHIPDRWLLATAVVLAGCAVSWWRLRARPDGLRSVGFGLMCFVPSITAVVSPCDVGMRAALLTLCLLPVIVHCMRRPVSREVWLAAWVAVYYLGTSSSISLGAHVAAFPLFLALWSASRDTSATTRAVAVSLAVWALYLAPGNTFDLKLVDLEDLFILSSATEKRIEFTVLTIAARHILPVTVFIWCMKWTAPRIAVCSMASSALVPVVCAIGLRLVAMLVSTGSVGLPWEQLVRLIVLLGYFVVFAGALLIGAVLWPIVTRSCPTRAQLPSGPAMEPS